MTNKPNNDGYLDMLSTIAIPAEAFRLEWKPGNYIFATVENYAIECGKEGARVWGLYKTPQPNCPQEIAVYRGSYWVQPKYVFGKSLVGFTPLYLGVMLHDGWEEFHSNTPESRQV